MFESIGRSIDLVKTSWNILMEDKKLLVFPVLSGLVTMIVILTFALPLIFAGIILGLATPGTGLFLVILFAFYAVSYFVVIFFNTALISCVNARLHGVEMTVREGLASALQHLPSILHGHSSPRR
jgi:ABC-type multidrug transport system fused ATPase/permease subunit